MSANLRSACEKFVPGHLPQKAGEEFALTNEVCETLKNIEGIAFYPNPP